MARAEQKKLKVDPETEEAGYYVTSVDLWPDERYITSKLYDDNKSGTEVKVTILDLPKLHNPSETVADEFATALSEVDDTEIFKCMSIKAIINFRWAPAKSFVLRRQLIPYAVFFDCYLIYVLFILDKHKDLMAEDHLEESEFPLWFKMLDTFWLIVLTVFSLYFLRQEYRQVKYRGWSYLTDVWNYADFVPPCIILLLVGVDAFSHEYT